MCKPRRKKKFYCGVIFNRETPKFLKNLSLLDHKSSENCLNKISCDYYCLSSVVTTYTKYPQQKEASNLLIETYNRNYAPFFLIQLDWLKNDVLDFKCLILRMSRFLGWFIDNSELDAKFQGCVSNEGWKRTQHYNKLAQNLLNWTTSSKYSLSPLFHCL